MPGLGQLKQFNKDILSLGDELNLRTSRGEQPVKVPFPKNISDADDSEDFVLGMPEDDAQTENASGPDDDISDLADVLSGTAAADSAGEAAGAPDFSSLLNPINVPDDASAGTEMPDLSQFMDAPAEDESPAEEPVSIADLGLDDLLSGAAAPDDDFSDDSSAELHGNQDDTAASGKENDSSDVTGSAAVSDDASSWNQSDSASADGNSGVLSGDDGFDFSDIPDIDDMDLDMDSLDGDVEDVPVSDVKVEDDNSPVTEENPPAGQDDAAATENSADSTDGVSGADMTGGDDTAAEPPAENVPAQAADAARNSDVTDGLGLDDIPFDDSLPDFGTGDDSGTEHEIFDTTGMDGVDFGSQDEVSGGNENSPDGGLDLGGGADFPMEGSDFEIPGFSDVAHAEPFKKTQEPKLQAPDFSGALEGDGTPPNTLTDKQYRQFLKNLSRYPLNVRLAFEDLIVKNEFTDDAEFEIIEKILNNAPARQVAAALEKMLDVSIPVPRDFEHRTAEEYEAYKKSIQYQLRNKIIPGIFVGLAALLVLIGVFNFCRHCIYIPAKASGLYRQGYALLQQEAYPQSEMKFNAAVKYRPSRKWFFRYAEGYRDHRQYQRSADIYGKILRYFNHDKRAGLEYAAMELDDLANYERAEEIVRRELLDYHINDPDGLLMLGDVYLEWATEKDPSKFEDAREQYATLIHLYKPNDLYLSRMMRYFIRTDNLREVLQIKNTFDTRRKNPLGAADLTELSGYLLDKLYGKLPPAEEYLKSSIEGVRGLLIKAVNADPENPVALYNLSRYYIKTGENQFIEPTLRSAISKFNSVRSIKPRDLYKYIDSYRLLGEHFVSRADYIQAQEQFTEGIALYTAERDNAGFAGTPQIGQLYEDLADIYYFISGDYDGALADYAHSVDLGNDTPQIRYRMGYVQYRNKKYADALSSFMKAGNGSSKDKNLLLAMGNTLSLRGDDYAAAGYYEALVSLLDGAVAERGILFPQKNASEYDIVNTYLAAANNYGVTLHRLAARTGSSSLNAQAIVQLQQSVRAWDSLTRNQDTLVRLEGSNLAEENIKYLTHPVPEFEPAIYVDIPKTLTDAEGI